MTGSTTVAMPKIAASSKPHSAPEDASYPGAPVHALCVDLKTPDLKVAKEINADYSLTLTLASPDAYVHDLVTEDAVDAEDGRAQKSAGLTFSHLRLRTQCAAVNYRRAVREHLQSMSRVSSHAVPRSCLHDLYSTPREILDDEVLSEDEGQSDLCATRKKSWLCSVSPKSVCGVYI